MKETIEELSEHLSSKLHILSNERGQRVFILGTAHVSESSIEDATLLVEHIAPKFVFLELCENRRNLLTDSKEEIMQTVDIRTVGKKLVNREWDVFGLMLSHMIHKEAVRQGVTPGGEFRAAFDAAQVVNAEVILGDRPITTTLRRTYFGLSLRERLSFALGLVIDTLYPLDAEESKKFMEELREKQELIAEQMQKFSDEHPWICEAIINERDAFMTLEMKKALHRLPEGDMVAIVGAGHVAGIKHNWAKEMTIQQIEDRRTFLAQCPDPKGPFRPKDMR